MTFVLVIFLSDITDYEGGEFQFFDELLEFFAVFGIFDRFHAGADDGDTCVGERSC